MKPNQAWEKAATSPPQRIWRSVVAAVAGAAALCAIQMSADVATSAGDACLNEAVRSQQGAGGLPQCRAYEMVTPVAKGSGEPEQGSVGGSQAPRLRADSLYAIDAARSSLDGDRLAWVSEPLPGAQAPGVSHLASRGAGGWASADLVPPMTPSNDVLCPLLMGVSGWSTDLTRSILDLPAGPPAVNAIAPGFRDEGECGHDEPRLVPGEPEHFRNLFVRDNLAGSHQLVNVTPSGVVWPEPEENPQRYWPASFLAGSDDLSHVVFEEELALTDDAPIGYRGGDELYEWVGGQVRLVTILPDETPVHGSLAGATRNYAAESDIAGQQTTNVAQFRHAVSADGSRIFFEALGNLYLREGGAKTFQVDESQGPGSSGGGKFMVASADGSRVFFTAESRLTPDSTANPGEPDLYEYRRQPGGTSSLEDLTVSSGEAANVLGVSGASEDGTYVYVVARGDLGSGPNSEGDTPVAGEANLYLLHNGETAFLATLDPIADQCDWTARAHCGGAEEAGPSLTARVSRGGEFLGFNSIRSLTGYDNTDAKTGEPDLEIYLYDAVANQLSCASCSPSGAPPTAGAAIHWPSNPGRNNNWSNAYPQRNVSDYGQVFFETADALLPQDVNGVRDVYEFFNGSLHLLSTGAGASGSRFLDATPDGSDVFIATAQPLLRRDKDLVTDYYDVRVDGGFLEALPPPPDCDAGSACRETGTAAAGPPQPGTSSFAGPGNARPRKKCRPKHHRRHHGKRAHHSRGQGKKAGSRVRHCKRAGNRKRGAK